VIAVLSFTCKTSILKPWDANIGLVATCVSIMLKTDNIGTGQLAPRFPLPPSPPTERGQDRDKNPEVS